MLRPEPAALALSRLTRHGPYQGQPLKISTQLNRHQRAVGCEARCSNTTSAAKRQAEADKEFPEAWEAWERKSRPTIRSRQLSRESLTRLRHYQGQPREI